MNPETLDHLRTAFIWTLIIFTLGHMAGAVIIAGTRRRVTQLEYNQRGDRITDYVNKRAGEKIADLERDLKTANATIDRVNGLCVTAEDAPIEYRNSITTAALREAIDGYKPPVKPVRRDPQSGLMMTREEYQAAHGFPAKPKLPGVNARRAAAGMPPAPEPVKVQPKTAKHAADPETTAQLNRTRRQLQTAQARLSRVWELRNDWVRYGEGGMSYKQAANDLLDAVLLEDEAKAPNPVIDLGNIRPGWVEPENGPATPYVTPTPTTTKDW